MRDMALRSRDIWLEALRSAKLNFRPTGSLHVAHRIDEADVPREFAERGPAVGYPCQWLTSEQTLAKSDAVQPIGLQGALWSDSELTVDPGQILAQFPIYLREIGVELRYGSTVRKIQLPRIETATETWEVDRAIVCAGDDFETLYPEIFVGSGLTRCMLQMLRTVRQPGNWQLGHRVGGRVDALILQGVSNLQIAGGAA